MNDLRVGLAKLRRKIDGRIAGAATCDQYAKSVSEGRATAKATEVRDVEVVEPGAHEAFVLVLRIARGIRKFLRIAS